MRKNIIYLAAIVLVAAFGVMAYAAQQKDKSSRPSPPAKAECELSEGHHVDIDYSSPRMKGRKIYGGLVPYDKVWRTGANEATTFVTDTDLNVGGTIVPAGNYTLFTVPGENKWQLVLSKKTGEWGTQYPGPENDLARIDMKVSALPAPMENFTIEFNHHDNHCVLRLDWETTRASVEISPK